MTGTIKVKARDHRHQARVKGIAGLLILFAAIAVFSNTAGAVLRIGGKLPSVTVLGINQESFRIPEGVSGKVVVLHFWQIGCSSCKEEIPALDQLYSQYRKKGLEILAVNIGQPKDSVKRFAAGLKVSYPILVDPDLKTTTPLEITDVPRTYVIDRGGVIRYRILGAVSPKVLKKLILSLL